MNRWWSAGVALAAQAVSAVVLAVVTRTVFATSAWGDLVAVVVSSVYGPAVAVMACVAVLRRRAGTSILRSSGIAVVAALVHVACSIGLLTTVGAMAPIGVLALGALIVARAVPAT